MNGLIDELKLICLATAIATAFGACGGGGGDTAVAAAPAAEVFVTMVRGINNGETRNGVRVLDNDATTVIVAVANAGIRVRAVRCISLSPPGGITTAAVQTPMLMQHGADLGLDGLGSAHAVSSKLLDRVADSAAAALHNKVTTAPA